MAKKKSDDDDTTNKLLWVLGTAAVTATAMYYVNKHLNEKEELNRLRFMEDHKAVGSGGGDGE